MSSPILDSDETSRIASSALDNQGALPEDDPDLSFEITDFSNATPWEKFVSNIEDLVRKWVVESEPGTFKHEAIKYNRQYFKLMYYNCHEYSEQQKLELLAASSSPTSPSSTATATAASGGSSSSSSGSNAPRSRNRLRAALPTVMEQLMDDRNDFPTRAHHLQRWFGVHEFLVMLPEGEWTDASDSGVLLSAMTVAINNAHINPAIPCFVPIGDTHSGVYVGRCQQDEKNANPIGSDGNSTMLDSPSLASSSSSFGSALSALANGIDDLTVCGSGNKVTSTTNPVLPLGAGITRFRADLVKEVPPTCTYLTGLLDLFTLNLGNQLSLHRNTSISARFTHILDQFDENLWKTWTVSENDLHPVYLLDSGLLQDPIEGLHISSRWPALSERELLSHPKSELLPDHAPFWSVRAIFADRADCECLLAGSLRIGVRLYEEALYDEDQHRNRHQQRQSGADSPGSSSSPFHYSEKTDRRNGVRGVFTSAMGTLSKLVTAVPRAWGISAEEDARLATDIQNAIHAIFVDFTSKNTGLTQPPASSPTSANLWLPQKDSMPKSCPVNSLPSLLSMQCILFENWPAVKRLWTSFLRELRARWEKCEPIPNIPSDVPDWSDCLLMQKLTMLNYCISKEKSRKEQTQQTHQSRSAATDGWDWEEDEKEETSIAQDPAVNHTQSENADGWEDEEDEFYDAIEEDSASPSEHPRSPSSVTSHTGGIRVKREGELHPMDGVFMLRRPEIPLYVPQLQEHPPMTEDMILHQQEVWTSLGSSKEGQLIRAKMQSASLLSDMQAFKAANQVIDDENALQLEDFIRWYSPKDLVEEGASSLSTRMQHADNLWRQVWETATPIPISRQKHLCDYVREGELVLHYLETLTPTQWMHELLVAAFVTAFVSLGQTPIARVPISHVSSSLSNLLSKMTSICGRRHKRCDELRELCLEFEKVEILIASCTSISRRFKGQWDMIAQLMSTSECELTTTNPQHKDAISAIKRCLALPSLSSSRGKATRSAEESGLRLPDAREFVFRCLMSPQSPDTRPTSHRMYTLLSDTEFRIATALSQDFI